MDEKRSRRRGEDGRPRGAADGTIQRSPAKDCEQLGMKNNDRTALPYGSKELGEGRKTMARRRNGGSRARQNPTSRCAAVAALQALARGNCSRGRRWGLSPLYRGWGTGDAPTTRGVGASSDGSALTARDAGGGRRRRQVGLGCQW
jgi:hypothetical protein